MVVVGGSGGGGRERGGGCGRSRKATATWLKCNSEQQNKGRCCAKGSSVNSLPRAGSAMWKPFTMICRANVAVM